VTARAEEASERIGQPRRAGGAGRGAGEGASPERRRTPISAPRRQARDYMLDARNRVEAALAAGRKCEVGIGAREARKLVEDAIAELNDNGRAGRETGRRADGLTGGPTRPG
jgi:hypothetical protein